MNTFLGIMSCMDIHNTVTEINNENTVKLFRMVPEGFLDKTKDNRLPPSQKQFSWKTAILARYCGNRASLPSNSTSSLFSSTWPKKLKMNSFGLLLITRTFSLSNSCRHTWNTQSIGSSCPSIHFKTSRIGRTQHLSNWRKRQSLAAFNKPTCPCKSFWITFWC